MFRYLLATLCVACLLSCGAMPAPAAPYLITDLGYANYVAPTGSGGTDENGWQSTAQGINSYGQVAGIGTVSNGDTVPYVWNPTKANGITGTNYGLGTLGYVLQAGMPASTGYGEAVNASGQVAGCAAAGPAGSAVSDAFLWTPSAPNGAPSLVNGNVTPALVNLTAANATFTSGFGYAINNNGIVAGYGNNTGGSGYFAFVAGVTGGSAWMANLGQSDGTMARPYGINDAGEVAIAVNAGGWKTYLYKPSGGLNSSSPAMITSGGGQNTWALTGSYAYYPRGIDADGDIVAYAGSKSYVWIPTTPNGTSGNWYQASAAGNGYGIWDAGSNAATLSVVGVNSIATVNRSTGAVIKETTLGSIFGASWLGHPFSAFTAYGVNGSGQVVGTAQYTDSGTTYGEGFLLTLALPGDANADGKVDINDLSKVLTNYDNSTADWSSGDFNADGKVDINDLSIVLTNYDRALGASAGIRAVPEPAALVLAGTALAALAAGAARKRRK